MRGDPDRQCLLLRSWCRFLLRCLVGHGSGTTNNRDGREVTMTAAVHGLLTQCVAGKSSEDAVFTRPDGKAVRDFRDTWARLPKPLVSPACCFTICAGIAEGVIMKIGGWRTRSVFERYAIVSQTEIAEALKKLKAT